MLEIEIRPDGGVKISGTEQDLKSLALHLLNAVQEGQASPTFISDRAVTTITIERTD